MMMRITAFFLCIVLAGLMFAGAASPDEDVAKDPEPLDEVVITAPLRKLGELRAAIVDAEDRFYERYNRLNANDDFDIECSLQARGTTLIKERVCEPKYVAEVKAQDGRAAVEAALACGADLEDIVRYGGCGYIPMTETIAQGRAPEARRQLLDVINRDEELRRMIQERDELQRRYEEARSKQFQDRAPVSK
jgi:hypothetical protein